MMDLLGEPISEEAFQSFYNERLRSFEEQSERARSIRQVVMFMVLVFYIANALVYDFSRKNPLNRISHYIVDYPQYLSDLRGSWFYMVVVAVGCSISVMLLTDRMLGRRFGVKVIKPIAKLADPGMQYIYSSAISEATVLSSQIYRKSNHFRAQDLFCGETKGIYYEFCYVLYMHRVLRYRDSIFNGFFFRLDFTESFGNGLVIIPASQASYTRSHQIETGVNTVTHKVILTGDEDFDNTFAVFAAEGVIVKDILTPKLRSHILNIHAQITDQLSLSFVDTRLFIAYSAPGENFVPAIIQDKVGARTCYQYYLRMLSFRRLIDEFAVAVQSRKEDDLHHYFLDSQAIQEI